MDKDDRRCSNPPAVNQSLPIDGSAHVMELPTGTRNAGPDLQGRGLLALLPDGRRVLIKWSGEIISLED